ncbi:MAG: hypothetical protein JXB85_04450 [Anaerolineales bacterium]|nr:hypothetical protein [Anaerolineales bacterium]
MDIHVGDRVMHWTYGLGQVVGFETRDLAGKTALYYAVRVRDLTIWVPADGKLDDRLRPPTSASGFASLFSILRGPGEPLPPDRHERKLQLVERLKDGRAESICRVIRDLAAYQQERSLNEHDQQLMKRAREALVAEWGYSLSILPAQAESELRLLLTSGKSGD